MPNGLLLPLNRSSLSATSLSAISCFDFAIFSAFAILYCQLCFDLAILAVLAFAIELCFGLVILTVLAFAIENVKLRLWS